MERKDILMKKRIIALVTAFVCMASSVSASVLGSGLVDSSSLLIGRGTSLYKNTFLSDQKGVGLQTEYYAEYTPNEDVRPVVVTGDAIWGKRNIEEAIAYMEKNNMYPMIGINASFFSFQYGVPMGHVITDGEITSKDATELDAVGFYQDGNAFVSRLGIKTTAYFDEYEFDIAHINKYCQAVTDVMTLYTDKFGANTNASCETINVILGNLEGSVSIGSEVTGVVEDVVTASGGIDIPAGKIVLTIPSGGNEWIRTLVNLLTPGEKITIKNEATVDSDRWNGVYNAIASEGKRLLSGGEVCSGLGAGAAPRTAVGVKADGKVIFYVIDGRQSGYSYGVKQATLAERMKELGCVDALNLDGGGSTSIAGVYPGQPAASVINSPSEGALRRVTNFIFLQNMQDKDDTLGGLYLYPYSTHYLSGTTVQLYPAAIDRHFHYMPAPEVEFSMGNDLGTVTSDGALTLSGTGEAVVNIKSGDITGGATYFTYETPTSITVYDIDTQKNVTSINADAKSTIRLAGHAYYGKKYLESEPKAYKWQIDERLGSISDGVLTLSAACGESGELTVRSGDTVVKIPVSINSYTDEASYPKADISVEEGCVNIEIYSENSEIDITGCSVKIDGKEYINNDDTEKTQLDDGHMFISIPTDGNFNSGFHKILVKAQNTDGFSAYNKAAVMNSEPYNAFSDTDKHWARDTISFMNGMGIVNGSNGRFNPDSHMTRAEFTVMMCNYLGVNADDYKDCRLDFADSSQIPLWAQNYVKAMTENDIISGKQDGNKLYFAPNDSITRAEAASIMARTLDGNLKIGRLEYTDEGQIPSWARKNMAVMTANGFMGGYPDGSLNPNGNVTRAEAVTMIFNIM